MNEELVDERSAKVRLRDAAMELVAEGGAQALTARAVAARSGVSQGMIRHHYGSMAGLLEACDSYVAAVVRNKKLDSVQAAAGYDLLAALRQADNAPMVAYLAGRLGDDSASITQLVDHLVADAVSYLDEGVQQGTIQPSSDQQGRAVVLTLMSLGGLIMRHHFKRLLDLDLDLTATDLSKEPGLTRYLAANFDVFSGLLNPDLVTRYRAALMQLQEEK